MGLTAIWVLILIAQCNLSVAIWGTGAKKIGKVSIRWVAYKNETTAANDDGRRRVFTSLSQNCSGLHPAWISLRAIVASSGLIITLMYGETGNELQVGEIHKSRINC